MDSISSHRMGVVTALDQGEYTRRGKVTEDRVLGRTISTVGAAREPRRERLVTRSVLLIT